MANTVVQEKPGHRIFITSYFKKNIIVNGLNLEDQGVSYDIRNIAFEFLPDSFTVPIRSEFERFPMPMTLGTILGYKGTTLNDINFQVKVVAGMDASRIIRNYPRGSVGTQQDLDYDNLVTLAQDLSALTLPQSADYTTGVAPPKSVLVVGSMLKASGVFDSVEFEFAGPYDHLGRPQEMQVTFNFIPTQFYDPAAGHARTGINVVRQSDVNLPYAPTGDGVNNQDVSTDTMSQRLSESPDARNVYNNPDKYIIYLGPRGSGG